MTSFSLTIDRSFNNTHQSIFCVYICALEQPWYFHLITTSNSPFVQLSWSLNGNHLLTCDRTGLCQVFQMKVHFSISSFFKNPMIDISFRMVVLTRWINCINIKLMKKFLVRNIFFQEKQFVWRNIPFK